MAHNPLVTLATVLADEPTMFEFGNKTYAPENYQQAYRGPVTVREALTYSLNVPAVHLAEMVGYRKVRRLCRGGWFQQSTGADARHRAGRLCRDAARGRRGLYDFR